MNRKTVLVTGANKGIGRGIALSIASLGYSVILACRDMEKAAQAASEIRTYTGNESVLAMRVDLASFASIDALVMEIRTKGIIVDVLINNAGVLCRNFQSSADGFELTMQTNYLGPYHLSTSLLPYIRKKTGRIIATSSVMFHFGRIRDDLFSMSDSTYKKFRAYANSKLASLLFMLELAHRLEPEGITVNVGDPGIVDTNILTMHNAIDPFTDALFRPFVKTVAEGAETFVLLACGDTVKGKTGGYYINGEERRLSSGILDHPRRTILWDNTERLLARRSGDIFLMQDRDA